MLATYTLGLIVPQALLTQYQMQCLDHIVTEHLLNVQHLTVKVPGFSPSSPVIPENVWTFFQKHLARTTLDVGRMPRGPLPASVLNYLKDADELYGFPARGRMRHKPDRIWSAYRMVKEWNERPQGSQWKAGVKIIHPWINETSGGAVKVGKK